MNRRHFLKTVNACSAAYALPTSALATLAAPRLEPINSVSQNAVMRNALRVGVVGIGGAGGNVMNYLAERLPHLYRTVAINTDADSLRWRKADRKIRIGDIDDEPVKSNMARRAIVRRNARSAADEIAEAVAGLDIVLLVAGMGGVAGSVISPVVAQVLREQEIFTLGVPILPFEWEGQRRGKIARYGARELGRQVNSLFPISNDSISQACSENVTMDEFFSHVSQVPLQLYRSVTNSVASNAAVGFDFADVRAIVSHEGYSAFGYGSASGVNQAAMAIRQAIDHPLLGQRRLRQASGVLIAVEAAPQTLGPDEAGYIISRFRKHLSPEASVIYSATPTLDAGDDLRLTVLARGIRDVRVLMGKNQMHYV